MLTIAHAAHAAAGAESCLPVFCQVFFVSCSSISCLESGDQAGPPRLAAKLGPHADATADATPREALYEDSARSGGRRGPGGASSTTRGPALPRGSSLQ